VLPNRRRTNRSDSIVTGSNAPSAPWPLPPAALESSELALGAERGACIAGARLKLWFFVVEVMDLSTMKKLSPCHFFEIRMHQLISTLLA
jgi:hypothetical protein